MPLPQTKEQKCKILVLWFFVKQGGATEVYESGHLCTLHYKGGCFLCIIPQNTYRGRGEIGGVYFNCFCVGRVPDPTSHFLPTSFCM
jgi:hypothetical protein